MKKVLVINETDPARRAMLEKDGPYRKFYLIKQFGARLQDAGFDPRAMSCAELRHAIERLCGAKENPMTAFVHRPKGRLNDVLFHPLHTKALWDEVWAEARRQNWWSDNLTCVGNKDGYFYFQSPGITTGYARVKVSGNGG